MKKVLGGVAVVVMALSFVPSQAQTFAESFCEKRCVAAVTLFSRGYAGKYTSELQETFFHGCYSGCMEEHNSSYDRCRRSGTTSEMRRCLDYYFYDVWK